MPTLTAPPTGTVTFLFTDIEGSTKLWERHPTAMSPARARHDVFLRDAIETSGGYVFKTVGDGFCAAFLTAPEALQAAHAAQIALANEIWETETAIRVRMALHTGAAEERDGDYFGPPLNRVARLMAAGHGGQLLLSAATQELTRDALPASASLLGLGSHRLRDLGRPETVFQLLHPSLPAEFPPLNSLDNPDLPNNLPQQVTSFIGREAQVAEIKALLGKTRLLTLTGAGGSGKSRLSLQVAADLLDGEGDGVWLVELAALSDSALVPQAVADVLGVKEQAGKTIGQSLVEWLKPKRLLLVLDNCEHLVAACASLTADLMRNCPHVHILASSREPLNVAGEQTYRVPSLSLPDPKQAQTVESVSQFEAVRLFIERAQAVQPSFAVTNGNVPALAQVCFRLDGIPLAIELAAARMRSLSTEEINARLDNRFRLLTGGSRVALPHQQTLRALIDWSYDLLTETEKVLLSRLSVFAGGWTLAAAEGVCAGEPVEDFEVLDLLTALVDKSLVVAETEEDATRYRLLETLRQYAGDRLAESGEAEAVRGRSASWFLAFSEEAEPQLAGPEQGAWLSRLEAEHDNLRASLAWEEQSAAGAEAGLRLSGSLWRFWQMRGHLSEGRQWLDRALARTKQGPDGAPGGEAATARGNALHGAGLLAGKQGDLDLARRLFEEMLTLYRHLGDQEGISYSLYSLGNVALEQSDYAAARRLFKETLALFRQLGDQEGIALSLSNLGRMAWLQGDNAVAQALGQESLTIRRQLGDKYSIADILTILGFVATDQGDYAVARALIEESLTIRRQLGDQTGITNSLFCLGRVAFDQGDHAMARRLFEESLTLSRQLGNQPGIADSLNGHAFTADGQSQWGRAARLGGAAFALRESLGIPLHPVGRKRFDKAMASAREAVGEETFAAAWDAGRAMTVEQAVEYALAVE